MGRHMRGERPHEIAVRVNHHDRAVGILHRGAGEMRHQGGFALLGLGDEQHMPVESAGKGALPLPGRHQLNLGGRNSADVARPPRRLGPRWTTAPAAGGSRNACSRGAWASA